MTFGEEENAFSLLMSPHDTELFESVDLYSGGGLEIAGLFVVQCWFQYCIIAVDVAKARTL